MPTTLRLSRVVFSLVCVALVVIVGGPSYAQSKEPRPLQVAICLGPGKAPLTRFAEHLQKSYNIECRWVEADKAKRSKGPDSYQTTPVDGIEALSTCDVILSNFYRTWAPPRALARLQSAFRTKPVVGLRKAHHGFQNWLDADQDVFGVDYGGHYFGRNVTLQIVEAQAEHPLLAGVKATMPGGGLYKHTAVAADVTVGMAGGPEDQPPHPQTWWRRVADRNQRVFYTRYDPDDLAQPTIRDMVARALCWAAQRDIEELRR